MAKDGPPGKVLPFKRSPKAAPPAPLGPRDPVFAAALEGVMGLVWRDLDGVAAVFDGMDLEAGLSWADEAIAKGAPGGHEARVDLLNLRAYRTLARGDAAAALAQWDALATEHPTNVAVHVMRARAHERRGDNEAAIADLDRAIEIGPDELGMAHFARGNAHQALGDLERALQSYDVAIERSPSNVGFRLRRFQIHNEAEDWLACQIDADAVLALVPDSKEVLLTHARLCARNNRRSEALADYDLLIGLDPGNADAYHERAGLHIGRGDTAAARADVARAFELNPDDPEIRASYGRDLGQAARTDEERAAAIRMIQSSAELDPENPAAWADAGRCCQMIGRHEEAVAHFTRAIELAPDDVDYYAERAQSIVSTGSAVSHDPEGRRPHLERALADVDRAIHLFDGEHFELYRRRATLREGLGDLRGALDDQRSIVALDPRFLEGYMDRARLRKLTGDMPGAVADAKRVRELEDETRANLAEFMDVSTLKRWNLDEA
jgi:tetratricopeptide (TPR) repeat protein